MLKRELLEENERLRNEIAALLKRADALKAEAKAANRLREVGDKAREATLSAIHAYQAIHPWKWEDGEQVAEEIPQMLSHLERTASI